MSVYGNNIYGESVLLVESTTGGGGSGGDLDHIVSPDLSSSVTCQNSGIIQSVGLVNFNNNSLNRVTDINGSTIAALNLNKVNAQISLGNSTLLASTNSVNRITADATDTQIISPNGNTYLSVSDTDLSAKVSGVTRVTMNAVVTALFDANTDPVLASTAGASTILISGPTAFVEITPVLFGVSTGGAIREMLTATDSSYFAPNGTTAVVIANTGSTVNLALTNGDIRAPSSAVDTYYNGTAADIRLGHNTGVSQINTYGNLLNNSNQVPFGLFGGSSTATTIPTSTAETDFFTSPAGNINITANSLKIGSIIMGEIGGNVTTGATTIRLRVRGGAGGTTGSVLMDSGLITVPASGAWSWKFTINVRIIGAAATAQTTASSQWFAAGGMSNNVFSNTSTFSTIVQNSISITGQWTAVGSDITRTMGYVCRLN